MKKELVFFVFGFGDVISVNGGEAKREQKKEKEREKKNQSSSIQRGQKAKSVSDLCSIQIAFDRGEHYHLNREYPYSVGCFRGKVNYYQALGSVDMRETNLPIYHDGPFPP